MNLLGAFLSTLSTTTVTFPSREHLQEAVAPHFLEEVEEVAAQAKIAIHYDPFVEKEKVIPLRHPETGDLLAHTLYKGKRVTLYYPAQPRVPHHLAIAINREEVKGLSDVTVEENEEIFQTIKKTAEVYKNIFSITGFVVAQFDRPQEGHKGRLVVEIIPELVECKGVKNVVDKVASNCHVVFRSANISPIVYKVGKQAVEEHIKCWRASLQQTYKPLVTQKITQRAESNFVQAAKISRLHFLQLLQNMGGKISEELDNSPIDIPIEIENPQTVQARKECFFCDEKVLKRQLVYDNGEVVVLYNMRKTEPGTSFLILPKRSKSGHVEKVYDLSEKEIQQMHLVRKALVEVLKEAHPNHQVIIYTQDDPSVGQTVFHTHEQVVSRPLDHNKNAFSWSLQSLHYLNSTNVSEEEMREICEKFAPLMEAKIKELEGLEKSA